MEVSKKKVYTMEINHRLGHEHHHDPEEGTFHVHVENFKEITSEEQKVPAQVSQRNSHRNHQALKPLIHKQPPNKARFGAKPADVSGVAGKVGGTAAKVAPQVVSSGLSSFWMMLIVVSVVGAALGTGFGGFFINQYISFYRSFFGSELGKIRVLEDNIFISPVGAGPYFPCPLGTTPNVSLCTLSENMNFVLAYIGQNGTNMTGTINTDKVFDVAQNTTQDIINANTLAADAANAAAAAAANGLATTANTTANGALALASTANTTANTALGLATTANNTANTALSDASTANTTANTALGLATTANNTANTALSNFNVLNITFYAHEASDNAMFLYLNQSIANITSNIANGSIYSTQVFDVPRGLNQELVNNALYAADAAQQSEINDINNSAQRLIRVEKFGNNTNCQIGHTYPCATLNAALALIGDNSPGSYYTIEIGAGIFNAVGFSTPWPCGITIVGQESSTIIQLLSQTMNANSVNSIANCAISVKSMQISILNYMNLTGSSSSLQIFSSTFENITFITATNPLIFNGNGSIATVNFVDVYSSAGPSSVTFNDMIVVASGFLLNTVVYFNQVLKNGLSSFYNFRIGNGFYFNNYRSTGTSQLFLYGGSNSDSSEWSFNTTTGGTTTLRGDATMGMINSNGQGGPIQLGSGTFTIERETYAAGVAFYAAVTTLWTDLGLSVPTTVQQAIDNLIFYLNSLDGRVIALEIPVAPNQNIYVETFGNDATCVINNINKPCATLDRVQQLIPNMTSDQVPWNVYLGGGYFFMSASSTLGCNQNWWGKESTRVYMANTLSPDPAKVAGAGSGYCQNRFFGITFFVDSGTTTLDYSATGLQILGFIFTNVTFAGSSTILHISAPNNPVSYINFFQVNYQGTLILDNFYFGAYWSAFGNPVLINSFFNKNLVYGFNQDIFYSYLNISTYGSSPSGFTLVKMYLCYEEQGTPTLFNFYGNNSLSVLECDSASCGLTNVNEGSFSGSATPDVRRNTNGKGTRLDQCVAGNWDSSICPAEINAAINQLAARLKTVETNAVTVSTFSISASYDGIWGSTQVATLSGYKIGNMVTLYFNPVVFTVTTSALISCSSIPPAFYPSNTMTMPMIVVDDSSFNNGAIQFNGAGSIFIGVSYANPGNGLVYQLQNFQVMNTGGIAATSITYFL